MKPILYVETNFVIGISKGQDAEASRFIADGFDDLQLVIPGVCFMETLSVLNAEEKQRNRFHSELSRQRAEFQRNKNSENAKDLVSHLERSRISGEKLLEEFRDRTFRFMKMITWGGQIIQIDSPAIEDALSWRGKIIADPTDSLILRCLVGHALLAPGVPKAFVSNNFNDFGQPAALKKLDEAGIRYFKEAKNAIGWLRSQILSQPDQP